MRVRDAAAGVPAAAVLEGFVRRKVIKQTVMTTVYGVTKFGARLQIAKQLNGKSKKKLKVYLDICKNFSIVEFISVFLCIFLTASL